MHLSKIHVLASYFNPVRYKSRKRNHLKWDRYWKRSGIEPWVVEVALGNRRFEVTDEDNPRHLQLRSLNEIWHKESSLNLLVQRLPRDWEIAVTSDNDVVSLQNGKKWLCDIIHAHQSYEIVQPFQSALDLGPHGQTLKTHDGFVFSHLDGNKEFTRAYGSWHPGYIWSYTKRAWNSIGGLFTAAVLGSGDDHMAKSLIGRGKDSLPTGLHPDYRRLVLDWEFQAQETKLDLGYLPHTIKHFFGGPKISRKYWSRWDGLRSIDDDGGFSPIIDLKLDWQGLWQLGDRSIKRRDFIRKYFRTRREDSIDVE